MVRHRFAGHHDGQQRRTRLCRTHSDVLRRDRDRPRYRDRANGANWLYVDSKDTGYYNSGWNPKRPKGLDPLLPVKADQRFEWRGWRPDINVSTRTSFSQHPQAVNQPYFTSWNNKQAPGYRAADAGYTSVYRSMPLDDGIVKPYHGIQWLENRGAFPFVEHTLAEMPGVSRAQAVDLDGDGDLDIVACALLASGADIDESTLPALGWLEQTRPGVFERHTLEKGGPRHASFDVGDVDHDGDVDIAVGTFMLVPGSPPSTNWVEIWENQRAH